MSVIRTSIWPIRLLKSSTGAEEIQAFFEENALWSLEDDKLHREYMFADFFQTFGLIAQATPTEGRK